MHTFHSDRILVQQQPSTSDITEFYYAFLHYITTFCNILAGPARVSVAGGILHTCDHAVGLDADLYLLQF